jgi:hypothetical protein
MVWRVTPTGPANQARATPDFHRVLLGVVQDALRMNDRECIVGCIQVDFFAKTAPGSKVAVICNHGSPPSGEPHGGRGRMTSRGTSFLYMLESPLWDEAFGLMKEGKTAISSPARAPVLRYNIEAWGYVP